ncbi:hypothetical protein A3715_32455 [Oleiphilus sp. HI0009]|nr:hypothetical protein A3715_11255 [Oleiphilus sp. HI0009]KZX83278.1 hypothetical protein A3715_32455 [Oleiphilus sp. HI0009]
MLDETVKIKWLLVGSVCWFIAFVLAAIYGPSYEGVNEQTFFIGAAVGALAVGVSEIFHGITNTKKTSGE